MNSPMSVALDASLWDEPTTGIGLVTRCLAGALQAQGVEVLRVGAARSGEFPRGALSRSAFVLARLPQVLAQLDAPIFHALGNFNLPLQRQAGKRLVLTVHDLIPELLPETVSAKFRWQFRLWLARSLQIADAVVCVSETTRQDLLSRYEVAPERVRVIPNGVDHALQVDPPDETTVRYLDALALPERFVLYAGALDQRKNVELVLRACAHLRAQGQPVCLVLAGQRWFGSSRVEALISELRSGGLDIRPLGYLQDPVFFALMRRAGVFVFPSRYEGFGLPPLEAMALGVPTIVSDAGALPEVCGPGALQVSPDDVPGLARAMGQLLHDPALRQQMVEKGQAQAARYTWGQAATMTRALYAQLLSGELR